MGKSSRSRQETSAQQRLKSRSELETVKSVEANVFYSRTVTTVGDVASVVGVTSSEGFLYCYNSVW